MKKRILVAGACGYIGSVLTPYLCSLGHQVTAIDAALNPVALRDACRYENLKIERVDCTDSYAVEPYIVDADVIYWLVGVTASPDLNFMQRVNVEAAKNLARLVWSSQTIVYPMTNAGYRPTDGVADESTPMIGLTPYSKTKIEAEKILMDTGRCVSFRLAAIYGPAPVIRWETLLNNMIWHAVHVDAPFKIYEPDVWRDVLYTSDLLVRMALPLHCDMRGEIFNLSGQSRRKGDFFWMIKPRTTIAELEHCSGSDPDKRDFIVSEDKIRRKYMAVSFEHLPITNLSVGIAATIRAAKLEK